MSRETYRPVDSVERLWRYPGSRPFQDTQRDRKLFRGRSLEAHALLHLVLAEKLVVVFAKSGLGKSSLINAGILQPLRERHFFPIVVRINDGESGPMRTVYKDIEDALRRNDIELGTLPEQRLGGPYGLAEAGASLPREGLAEHCLQRRVPLWLFFKVAELWRGDDLLEPVLIFDQFEELFTLQAPAARAELIDELAPLVRGQIPLDAVAGADDGEPELRAPLVKVVISLREEFLGSLQELAPKIPGILSTRYRLKPMSREQAREAIVEPATLDDQEVGNNRFSYTPEVVDAILEHLSRHRLRGKMVPTDEVEPSQLQTICQYLEDLVRQPGHAPDITLDDLGGRRDRVDKVLKAVFGTYYDEQTAKIGGWFRRRAVRRLCETGLIVDERRASVDSASLRKSFGVSALELSKLTDSHLLRAVPRLDSVQYELSHDTLVDAILTAKEKRQRQQNRYAFLFLALGLLTVVLLSLPQWKAAARARALEKQDEVLAGMLDLSRDDPVAFLIQVVDGADQARRGTDTVPPGMARLLEETLDQAREIDRDPGSDLGGAGRDGAGRVTAVRTEAGLVELRDGDGQPIGDSDFWAKLEDPKDLVAGVYARLPGDAMRIVVADRFDQMLSWSPADGPQLAVTQVEKGPTSQLTDVAIDFSGEKLVTASLDGSLRLWSVDGEALGPPWPAHPRGVVVTAFDPRRGHLVSGGADGYLRLWDLEQEPPKKLSEIKALQDKVEDEVADDVTTVAWSPDGEIIVSGSLDGAVRLWNPGTKRLDVLDQHSRAVLSVAVNGEGDIAAGSADGVVRWWNPDKKVDGEFFDENAPEDNEINSVAWSPDGRRILSGGSDKQVLLWTLGEALPTPVGSHEGHVLAVAFHPAQGYLVSGGRDGSVRAWKAGNATLQSSISGFKRYVNSVRFAQGSDSRVGVYSSFGGTVRVVRGGAAKPDVTELIGGNQHHLTALALSADGSRIVSGSTDGTLRLWTWESGRFRRLMRPIRGGWGRVEAVAISLEPTRIAAGTRDGEVWVWQVEEDRLVDRVIGPLRGHRGPIEALDFHHEPAEPSETMVSVGADGTRYWDLAEMARGSDIPAGDTGRWTPPKDWLEPACRRLSNHPLLRQSSSMEPGLDSSMVARVRQLCSQASR